MFAVSQTRLPKTCRLTGRSKISGTSKSLSFSERSIEILIDVRLPFSGLSRTTDVITGSYDVGIISSGKLGGDASLATVGNEAATDDSGVATTDSGRSVLVLTSEGL